MDYYEELGINSSSTMDEIHRAHHRLSKLFHPDQQTDDALKLLAETQMRRLNAIVGILSDPELRHQYDDQLKGTAIVPLATSCPRTMRRNDFNLHFDGERRRLLPWWIWTPLSAVVLTIGVVWFWADDVGSSFSNQTQAYAHRAIQEETARKNGRRNSSNITSGSDKEQNAVNLAREKLPPAPPVLPMPHPASVSASVGTTHATVRVSRALDAFAHSPVAIPRLQDAFPHPPVVSLSEPLSAAQRGPTYVPELPGLPPLKTPAVSTSEMAKQSGPSRNTAPVQTVSAPVRKPTSVSPAYIPLPPSAPRPLRQVMPPATPAGVILYEDVQVKIEMSVDERGRVIAARPLGSPEKVSQLLLGVALNAATQWQFQPATLHGRAVGSEYIVVFQFHPKQY